MVSVRVGAKVMVRVVVRVVRGHNLPDAVHHSAFRRHTIQHLVQDYAYG